MTQRELIEQAINYIGWNLTNDSTLLLMREALESMLSSLQYELVTNEDKKAYSTLTTISLQLKEIIDNHQFNDKKTTFDSIDYIRYFMDSGKNKADITKDDILNYINKEMGTR